MIGVRALMRSKSSMESGMFASLAMASRCRTALVEPPVAATPAMAFSMAVLVMICDGVTIVAQKIHDHFAGAMACVSFSCDRWPERRRAPSERCREIRRPCAMVLAVNWPPQAPAPGQAMSSSALSRASVILPCAWEPMASKTS